MYLLVFCNISIKPNNFTIYDCNTIRLPIPSWTGMVNVKKNYVINGKISYLMIIFDYHYQIKINVNFSHGLS
jgi:hypothetical protein